MPENRQWNRRKPAKLTPEMEAKKYKPGRSGNPGGRPKKTKLTEAYRQILEELVPGDPKGRTYAQLIAWGMVKSALKGRSDAAREIGDRTEGRARQAIDLGGSAENPLSFTVITTVAGNEP